MKVPFRQQASDYNCGSTSLLNALCYMFDRKDIPPFVVHQIYRDCLDLDDARGTSSRAMHDLGFCLTHYREERYAKFAVESEYICGKQVHLRQNSKIIRCLYEQGTAVMTVRSSRNYWHHIIGIGVDGGWLHCYDPSPRSKRFINNDAVQFVTTSCHQEPNLIIRCDWLDETYKAENDSNSSKYVFGSVADRECLLLRRKNF